MTVFGHNQVPALPTVPCACMGTSTRSRSTTSERACPPPLLGSIHTGPPDACERLPEHLPADGDVHRVTAQGHRMHGSTLYADLVQDRHAAEAGEPQEEAAQPPVALRCRPNSASEGLGSPHVHRAPAPRAPHLFTARRHTHSTGGGVSYSVLDEVEHPAGEAAAQSGNVSLLSRMLSAVDISSCMAPGPPRAGTAPRQHRSTHDPSRRSLPGHEVLTALSDHSFTHHANGHPLPRRADSVSAPGGIGSSAAAAAFSSNLSWYASVAAQDMDGNSTVAGYSSCSAAYLPSHRRSGFASFTQSLRRSLKSLGGLSLGCGSNFGEAGDAAMQSDSESADLCPICMDADVSVSVQACSHRLCVDCARRLCVAAVKPVYCPLCRTVVDRFVKVDVM